MTDAYCGIKKIPKNKKRGSMKECAEKGQVYYWGLNKIDSRTLENAKVQKKMSLDATRRNKIKYTTKLKKLTKDLGHEKNKKEQDKKKQNSLKKDITKTEKLLDQASKDFSKAFELAEQKKLKKTKK